MSPSAIGTDSVHSNRGLSPTKENSLDIKRIGRNPATAPSRSRGSQISASVAGTNLESALARRDEVSGVSLDEEFTSLIRFQQAYQASAKMIKVADELLQQIANLI